MEQRNPNHPGDQSTNSRITEELRDPAELNARARAMDLLRNAEIPCLIGGAYAFGAYTKIYRDTKDLDLHLRKEDAIRALEVFEDDGWRTERRDEVWLYKAYLGDFFVDLIFSSGNAIAVVDDLWFQHSRECFMFGRRALVIPAEELIWSKAFVLERERYDGADVVHLIKVLGVELDWDRLVWRFGENWEVLLSHLVLFRYAFPSERSTIPQWVMRELLCRCVDSTAEGNWKERVCRGTLLSNANYVVDVRDWGYQDGRQRTDRERGVERATGPELKVESGGLR